MLYICCVVCVGHSCSLLSQGPGDGRLRVDIYRDMAGLYMYDVDRRAEQGPCCLRHRDWRVSQSNSSQEIGKKKSPRRSAAQQNHRLNF